MSVDQGNVGAMPRGAVALGTESRPGGSVRRAIHRAILLTMLAGTVAALAAWATFLVYGGVWLVQQIPLV